jgi:hypothetical protein
MKLTIGVTYKWTGKQPVTPESIKALKGGVVTEVETSADADGKKKQFGMVIETPDGDHRLIETGGSVKIRTEKV